MRRGVTLTALIFELEPKFLYGSENGGTVGARIRFLHADPFQIEQSQRSVRPAT
jgi:hypothetical protein